MAALSGDGSTSSEEPSSSASGEKDLGEDRVAGRATLALEAGVFLHAALDLVAVHEGAHVGADHVLGKLLRGVGAEILLGEGRRNARAIGAIFDAVGVADHTGSGREEVLGEFLALRRRRWSSGTGRIALRTLLRLVVGQVIRAAIALAIEAVARGGGVAMLLFVLGIAFLRIRRAVLLALREIRLALLAVQRISQRRRQADANSERHENTNLRLKPHPGLLVVRTQLHFATHPAFARRHRHVRGS